MEQLMVAFQVSIKETIKEELINLSEKQEVETWEKISKK